MRRLLTFVVMIAVLSTAWYFVWRDIMQDKVRQVEASIDHHARAIRAESPNANFKADAVYATGFPYKFRVALDRPTLTQVWGDESFGVSFARIELQSINAGEGRYRVYLPTPLDAVYAKAGRSPERYVVSAQEKPGFMLRAVGNSLRCSNLPGAPLCKAKEGAPLVSLAVEMPVDLLLDVSLNGKQQQIKFESLPLGLPIFQTIPANVTRPLQIFIGMLREAMVFSKP